MIHPSFLHLLTLSSVVFAYPNSSPSCPVISQDANFDDLQATTATPATPAFVPAGYRGLYFQAVTYFQDLNPGTTPGLIAHSPPNAAAITAQSQTMQGTAMLTTNYPKTNTSSFTLQNFYFGCTNNLENNAADTVAACNINIAGYRGNDNQVSNAQEVCAQQVQYNPSTAVGAQQLAFSGSIWGCTDIQFLIITFTPPGGNSATSPTLALVLDDIRFTSKAC